MRAQDINTKIVLLVVGILAITAATWRMSIYDANRKVYDAKVKAEIQVEALQKQLSQEHEVMTKAEDRAKALQEQLSLQLLVMTKELVLNESMPPSSKFAYCTNAHDDEYMKGAIVMLVSVKMQRSAEQIQSKTAPDLCILALPRVSKELRAFATTQGIRVVDVAPIHVPNVPSQYTDSFVKFRIWERTEYTKVVMLDTDILALKNADELFDKPELSAPMCPHGRLVNPVGWLSSAVFVLEPSMDRFRTLMTGLAKNTRPMADMDYMQDVYGKTYHVLPPRYLTLTWQMDYPHIPVNDMLAAVTFLHYSGKKPWQVRESRTKKWAESGPKSNLMYPKWWAVHDKIWPRSAASR
eukprot:m.295502 g.295502  ORF g.295502 m.295502 type:complete len:353 (+) comp16262_c0_seq4:177-1235(+)